jgi:hypothetical protein
MIIAPIPVNEQERLAALQSYFLQDDALVVPDAVNDVRFCDNPLVSSAPFIRFYAGIPLIPPEGYHLNSVCYLSCAKGTFIRQRYSFKNFSQRCHEARVKTEEQKQRLLQKGCNQFQGALFGKPVALHEFEEKLQRAGLKIFW